MAFKHEPQISRPRRQSAVEQTSDLLKAYLEHLSDQPASDDDDVMADTHERLSLLNAGFILPFHRTA